MVERRVLVLGKNISVTLTEEQHKKRQLLKGTTYILSKDIRENWLDQILDKAIKENCPEKYHDKNTLS